MNTLYYLEHRDQSRRLKPYSTLTGARIAQANRNRHLGFQNPQGRYTDDRGRECIQYNCKGDTVTGTWCIREDTVDSNRDSLYED